MGKFYEELSLSERVYVQSQLELGFKAAAIATALKREPSTIGRELRRNGWKRPAWSHAKAEDRPLPPSSYGANRAQQRAKEKAALPRVQRRLVPGTPLWEMVIDNLRASLSPEQIAATLKRMAPALAPVQLSHEAIYQAIYAMPRGELRSEVIALLRHGHNKRRPRARGKDRRGQIPNLVPISERPAEIKERLIPGHWEGDTIKGKYNRCAVGTLVERSTLFALLAKMNGAGAEAAVEGFTRVLDRVEAQKRLSITYDRGKKMAQHETLTANTGVKVNFADPHAPWQRGINENTNGLIRQFLSKGEDPSIHSQEELDKFAWLLNARPRKSLGWKCPAELFLQDFDFVKYYSHFFALRS
jgi:IS30 family transposase